MKNLFFLLSFIFLSSIKAQTKNCNSDSLIAVHKLNFEYRKISGSVESVSNQKLPNLTCDEIIDILKVRDKRKIVIWKKDEFVELLIEPCSDCINK
jgi:hypothetical protein